MPSNKLIQLGLAAALLVAGAGLAAAQESGVRPDWERYLRLAGIEGQSYLGVGVQEINSERAKALKLKEEYGVEITRVEDDSPASRAGLQVKDVVLEYNGQRVEGTEQFVRLVRETPANRTVRLSVNRGGSATTVQALIGARKHAVITGVPLESFKWKSPEFEMVMPDIPKATMSWRSSTLGVEAESLGESQLSDFFGVKEGVLVRSVMKNSTAEKAGLKAGDVIVKVNETKVTTPRDVTAALRAARNDGKKSFAAVVMREKRETTLTINLDDEPAPPGPPPAPRVRLRQMKL